MRLGAFLAIAALAGCQSLSFGPRATAQLQLINVVPQVRGRVTEVPVEPNRPVKKGDVLFKIDPTPYELTVRSLEAQLANTSASQKELDVPLAVNSGC